MWQWITGYWRSNGTRLIGQLWVSLGMIATLDHETLQKVESAAGPVWAPRITWAVWIIGGLVVWRRGITNAARIAQQASTP